MKLLHGFIPIAVAAVTVIAAGVLYCFGNGRGESLVFNEKENQTEEETLRSGNSLQPDRQGGVEGDEAVPSGAQGASVCVHVCGSVREEGVYFLSEDARISDAIAAAGGFKEDASTSYLNLAARITDGMKIYVPSLEEVTRGDIPKDNENAMPGMTGDGRININTAGLEALMTLPGIGETRAGDIIAWRDAHGGFSEITDIMNVSGIKEAMFERIKDRICVR